jgi:AraC-like DNA-binding protein
MPSRPVDAPFPGGGTSRLWKADPMTVVVATHRRLLATLIEKSLSFDLLGCDLTPVSHPFSTSWRTLPFMAVAHLQDGTDLIEFQDRAAIPIGLNQALCIPAGIHHRITVTNRNRAISRWAHIQYTVFSSLDLIAMLDPPMLFSGASATRIGDCSAECVAARQDGSMRSISRRVAAAYALLDTIIEQCPAPGKHLETLRDAQRLAPALAHMELLLGNADLDLPVLARMTDLSVSRFHALFKHAIGLSPTAYLLNRRMVRAEGLLVGSSLKVREVAHRCGWPDEFHFSRLFKRLHGMSPLAYREQMKKSVI